MEYTRII